MTIYKINGVPTPEKIEQYDEDRITFYRFQNPEHEIGTESWMCTCKSKEEAIREGYEILNGKSCCYTANDLLDYEPFYGDDYVVLVVNGWQQEESGDDDEPLVDISEILEVWKTSDLVKVMNDIWEQ